MTDDELQAAITLAAQNIVADRELRKWREVWLAVAVLALTSALWMGRYAIIPARNAAHLKLDRWTGEVYYCAGSKCFIPGE